MRVPRRFTSEEDDFLRNNYRKMSARDIGKALGRTETPIRKRADKLGLTKHLKRWTKEEDKLVLETWNQHGKLDNLAKRLDRGVSEVSARAKKLGLSSWRHKPVRASGRLVDGFVDGVPIWTHRRVAEEKLGRKLLPNEVVHHIDGNKDKNTPSNLYIFSNRSEHAKAHLSLTSLLSGLLSKGYIRFNDITGLYELCETNN